MLEFNVIGFCLMEIDDSIETFELSRYVLLGSTREPTTVNNFSMTDFQCILTPSFITVEMFDLVVPYCFAVLFFHKKYNCLYQIIDTMIPFLPIRLCKRHDTS